MPELPEVETIVRGLLDYVCGRQITALEIRLPRIASPSADILASVLPGRTIVGCHRRAKYIVFTLDTKDVVLVHLRMTGRLIYVAPLSAGASTPELPRYAHLSFQLDNGAWVHFADARTFGRMTLVPRDEQWDQRLGIEPLDTAFTALALIEILARRRGPIKNVLLDQRLIAGIGNIYACEALWAARINPNTPACELSRPQIRRLHCELQAVLSLAIEMRGTSARDYVDAEGLKGGFQNVLSVYGKAGAPCDRCQTLIIRTVIAQRGTWWCTTCQALKVTL